MGSVALAPSFKLRSPIIGLEQIHPLTRDVAGSFKNAIVEVLFICLASNFQTPAKQMFIGKPVCRHL